MLIFYRIILLFLCQRSANKVIIITSEFDGGNLCDYLSNCLADGHVTIIPPPPLPTRTSQLCVNVRPIVLN